MTLSNNPLEELQALLEDAESKTRYWPSGVEEIRAAIAAKAEPDYEAWRPALERFYAYAQEGDLGAVPLDYDDIANIKGLIAALPLAPAEPVDDAWIERTARQCSYAVSEAGHNPDNELFECAKAAIRATLARCARWPDEVELEEKTGAAS
jgi:hypothetical protein